MWYWFWRHESCTIWKSRGENVELAPCNRVLVHEERPLVKVQCQLQWRTQGVGDDRTTGEPSRTVAGVVWSCSKPVTAVCSLDGRVGEVGWINPCGARKIISDSQVSDIELKVLDIYPWLCWLGGSYASVLPFWNKKYESSFWFCKMLQVRDF